jgi:urease accessory protein UreF
MWPLHQPHREAVEWLGDAHPLVEQLGSADGLVAWQALSARLLARPVGDLAALREFLLRYRERILIPLELPAIQVAFAHAARCELRELVAFDRRLTREAELGESAAASRRVGRAQLQKLRPLRDERVIQRYLCAVEAGEAHGWHTLVYGLSLVVYSLPLRQGLLGYAHQVMRGFTHTGAKALSATEADYRALLEDLCEPLPAAVERMLTRDPTADT